MPFAVGEATQLKGVPGASLAGYQATLATSSSITVTEGDVNWLNPVGAVHPGAAKIVLWLNAYDIAEF